MVNTKGDSLLVKLLLVDMKSCHFNKAYEECVLTV